jgi:hypothetical protein
LESLPSEITKYVIDGKFKWNPAENDLSNPHLRRKVKKFDNVILVDAPNLTEPEKRQKYIDLCAENGNRICFIIDSDEYILQADWPSFYRTCSRLESGLHNIQTKHRAQRLLQPRVWINPSEWKYEICHCWFKNVKTGTLLKGCATPKSVTFTKILLGTDDSLRTDEWMKNTEEYQNKLWAFETPLRRK